MAIRSDKNDKLLPARRPLRRRAGQAHRRRLRRIRAARRQERHPGRARSSRGGVPQARLRRACTSSSPASRRPRMFIAQEPLPVLNGRVTGIGRRAALHQPSASPAPRSRSTRSTPRPASARSRAGASQDDRRRRLVRALRRRPTPTTSSCSRMAGQPVTHTYRSPFLRSSDVVHLRPGAFAKGDETGGRRRDHEPAARLFRRRPRQVHRSTARCRPASTTACPASRSASSPFDAQRAHGAGGVQQRDSSRPAPGP